MMSSKEAEYLFETTVLCSNPQQGYTSKYPDLCSSGSSVHIYGVYVPVFLSQSALVSVVVVPQIKQSPWISQDLLSSNGPVHVPALAA